MNGCIANGYVTFPMCLFTVNIIRTLNALANRSLKIFTAIRERKCALYIYKALTNSLLNEPNSCDPLPV